MPAIGQVNVKKGGRHHHINAEILQFEVEHLDANAVRHLSKVLSCDLDPFPGFDQRPLPGKPLKFWLKR